MKRCGQRRHKGGPCKEHTLQMALFDQPGNAGLKARYERLAAAFIRWEQAAKEAKGQPVGSSLKLRDATAELRRVARER